MEREVLAEAFYVARLTGEWPARPFWMLRRCVVPYVAANQFLVLRKDGLPVAFAGWVLEPEGAARPWRDDRYLPSATDFAAVGAVCVTELISPLLPATRVVQEVGRWLKLGTPPAWIERDAERRVVAVHQS